MKTFLVPLISALLPGVFATAVPVVTEDPVSVDALLAVEERADGLSAPEPEVAGAQLVEPLAAVQDEPAEVRPSEWLPRTRRCRRRGRRHYCDGPRMVPVAGADAQARAIALELGKNRTASTLFLRAPDERWVEAVESKADNTMLWPVEAGRLGRGVGYVRRSSLRHVHHDGVDIPAPVGSDVRAVNDGVVAYSDNGVSGYGNLVLIVHADGSSSVYAHLREAWVAAGQRVRRGQKIGEVGTTGLAYGPHLHFEWRVNGRPADPVPHFAGRPDVAEDHEVVALASL